MINVPADSNLIAVARGDRPADFIFANARVVNVFTREIDQASVAIFNGRIAGVGDYADAKKSVDIDGAFICPGLIDAHMHIESTMLPPGEFVRLAVPHGTTAVVLDPHEIANVCGLDGIEYLINASANLPIDAMFALSSCVPSSPLETSGAQLGADDLKPLFGEARQNSIVALAEMMNFPGVVSADPDVLAKINLGLDEHIVDGHSPGLTGKPLQAYLAAGVSSDHECTTAEEAAEKLRLGMRIYIRQGSAARNLHDLLSVVTDTNAHRFCFCTDDRHPADLANDGHIDHIVRLAIAGGLDPATAIAMGSLHTALHYGRRDIGAIAPGYRADLIVFDDPARFQPREVYFRGELIARDGNFLPPRSSQPATPPVSAVRVPEKFDEQSLRVEAGSKKPIIRVIGMNPHQLVTEHLTMDATVEDDCCVADTNRDVLKLAVIERHHGTGNIGLGFVNGFGLTRGAIGSTVGHDSHNLIVVGTNDTDMVAAARALTETGGGQCAVFEGDVLAVLPLPIAGLMSDQHAETVIEQQRTLHEATRTLGCELDDPFMPLSFLPLPVIPQLKLTDLGLVDVEQFKIVPLELR